MHVINTTQVHLPKIRVNIRRLTCTKIQDHVHTHNGCTTVVCVIHYPYIGYRGGGTLYAFYTFYVIVISGVRSHVHLLYHNTRSNATDIQVQFVRATMYIYPGELVYVGM